jgi:ketosteroid isomerase-like protein
MKQTVHRLAAAVTTADRELLEVLVVPDVEWLSAFAAISKQRPYHGYAGLEQYSREMREAFDAFEVTIDDVLVIGQTAVAVGNVRFRGAASGVDQTEPFGWIVHFEDDKVVSMRAFRNPEEVLAQVS